MVTLVFLIALPHTNLAKHYVILAFNRRKHLNINVTCGIMTPSIKVSDAIEQSDIYLIMALRNYFDMVHKSYPKPIE